MLASDAARRVSYSRSRMWQDFYLIWKTITMSAYSSVIPLYLMTRLFASTISTSTSDVPIVASDLSGMRRSVKTTTTMSTTVCEAITATHIPGVMPHFAASYVVIP